MLGPKNAVFLDAPRQQQHRHEHLHPRLARPAAEINLRKRMKMGEDL
jgi:hypothetical protein